MRAAVIALPISLAVAAATGAALLGVVASAEEPAGDAAQTTEQATPTIYKWIDERGIAHYTTDRERIPKRLRDKVGRPAPQVEPEPPPVEEAPVEEAVGGQAAPLPQPAPAREFNEQWAVRDRSYERPRDVWKAADDYGDAPSAEPTAEGETRSDTADTRVADRRRRLEELDQRIALLETDIAASEEALKALISLPVPEGGGAIAMADDAQFREMAGRLPGLLADLRALQDERAQLEAP